MDRISDLLKRQEESDLKARPQHFTRGGPLQPELLITLLLHLVADGGRRGYRNLLEQFWSEARTQGVALAVAEPISAVAFCRARHRLKPSAIRTLLRDTVANFDREHGSPHRFRGRRVLAIDGSKISTQRSPELWEEFGGPTDGFTPQIMLSTLIDVLAKLPVDATVAPYASNEREQAIALLDSLCPGDILLLDRGYPSYDIIWKLLERQIDFIIRVPAEGSFSAIETFLQAEGEDHRILLAPPPNSSAKNAFTVELRAVRRTGPEGEPQVFLTSLRRAEFSRAEILDLYRRRWEVETYFRLEKGSYLGHEQFHARTPDGVRQEVFALHLFVALTRTLMATAAELHDVTYDELSQKGAILATAATVVTLVLQRDPERARDDLQHVLQRIARCRDRKRPNRSFPRRSFKPRPRWGPSGNGK